jgi:hypothetical protein
VSLTAAIVETERTHAERTERNRTKAMRVRQITDDHADEATSREMPLKFGSTPPVAYRTGLGQSGGTRSLQT